MRRKELRRLHRLAWPGNAMHLKAGGEEGAQDEQRDGEEGGGEVFEGVRMGEEKREWRRRSRR